MSFKQVDLRKGEKNGKYINITNIRDEQFRRLGGKNGREVF